MTRHLHRQYRLHRRHPGGDRQCDRVQCGSRAAILLRTVTAVEGSGGGILGYGQVTIQGSLVEGNQAVGGAGAYGSTARAGQGGNAYRRWRHPG